MTTQRITFPDVWVDTASINGDGSINNPLRAAASGPLAPSNFYEQDTYTYVDDWLAPSKTLTQNSGWDSIPLGSIYSLTLAGGGSQVSTTSDTGRLGVILAQVQLASANGFVRLATQSGARMSLFSVLEYEAVVSVNLLSTLAESFWVDIGIFSTVDGELGRAVFRYDQSNSQGGNPTNLDKWMCATVDGASSTQQILDGTGGRPNVPVVPAFFPTAGFIRLLVRLLPDRAEFFVNGVLATTITTNLPLNAPLAVGFGVQKTTGDVDFKGLFVDYTRATIKLAAPRTP